MTLAALHRRRLDLVSITPAGTALRVVIRDHEGDRELRITRADSPGLELLADGDRGRVRSALLALHRSAEGPPTAA